VKLETKTKSNTSNDNTAYEFVILLYIYLEVEDCRTHSKQRTFFLLHTSILPKFFISKYYTFSYFTALLLLFTDTTNCVPVL